MDLMITVAGKSANATFLQLSYDLGVRKYRLNSAYPIQRELGLLKNMGMPDIQTFLDFPGVRPRIHLPLSMKPEINILPGEITRIQISYCDNRQIYISDIEENLGCIQKGCNLMLSDGLLKGTITNVDSSFFDVKWNFVDYKLRDNAGCFLSHPKFFIGTNALYCEKIANQVISQGLKPNWIIFSFVETPHTIGEEAIQILHKAGILVMAKVETPLGIQNLYEISKSVDGIMIGRGDLKSSSGQNFDSNYETALNSLDKLKSKYNGAGTFFLREFSETGQITEPEIRDIIKAREKGCKYIMLSKEVVNSGYPVETLKEAFSLCNK